MFSKICSSLGLVQTDLISKKCLYDINNYFVLQKKKVFMMLFNKKIFKGKFYSYFMML